jgi:hypothetical protein
VGGLRSTTPNDRYVPFLPHSAFEKLFQGDDNLHNHNSVLFGMGAKPIFQKRAARSLLVDGGASDETVLVDHVG